MEKTLPKLAAVSLCLLSLTGCVSRGEPGPAFPEGHSPNSPAMGSPTPATGPDGISAAPKATGTWDGIVGAVTDNPVTRTFKSAGQKTAETLTPKPHESSDYDAVSLSSRTPKADASMFVQMAQVHESSNNLDAAAQSYDKALKLDKKYVPAVVGLAQVRFRQQKHDEAYQLFTQARKLDPHNLQAMLGQAHYHDTRENMPEATRLYTEATQRHPDSARAWNDLGLCLARQGRLPESQQTLQRSVQLEPTNVLYRNNLATVLVELKQNQEALVHLQQVHGPAAGHYNLGFLLHRRGEEQAAADQFNMALRVDPSFEPARQWLEKLNSSQGNSQRAARPPMGRAAALMPGPDGRLRPILANNFKRTKGLLAPPEIEHLSDSGPLDVIVESKATEPLKKKLMEPAAEEVYLAVSTAEDADLEEAVVPVAAIEISDESAMESDEVSGSEPTPAPVPRVRVNRAYEAEFESPEPEHADQGSTSLLPGRNLPDGFKPVTSHLQQPRLVTGITKVGNSVNSAAIELPSAISQLQPANDEVVQLEAPPEGDVNGADARASTIENDVEPYYELASNVEEHRSESTDERVPPIRPVSLYDSAESSAEQQPASSTSSKAIEQAAKHGWKKVKVQW